MTGSGEVANFFLGGGWQNALIYPLLAQSKTLAIKPTAVKLKLKTEFRRQNASGNA